MVYEGEVQFIVGIDGNLEADPKEVGIRIDSDASWATAQVRVPPP